MRLPKPLKVILLLTPGLGLILALVGMVVYTAVAQSFGYYGLDGPGEFSTQWWSKVTDRKLFSKSLLYSLYIGFSSAFISVIFAYPLAIWLRKPFKGSLLIGTLIKAPLMVNGLVAAFLFINVIAYHGVFNQLMQWIGFWDAPKRLQNDQHAIMVILLQAWKNIPFALLILTGSVQSISDDIIDAAKDLGAGQWSRFRKIIAPLTLSGMQASLIIIFIGALSDFSFQVIAGPTNRQSITQLMLFFKDRGDVHSSAVVGISLMIAALLGSALLSLISNLVLKGKLR